MKTILENAIRQILINRKLFYINLLNGNEKCIQGDLYSELNRNSELNTALEFPIGNREHADIAFFNNNSFEQLDCVVELKHYSPHQSNPEQSAVGEIKKEIIKRFKNNIQEIYVVQILTQVVNVSNQAVLNNFPFTKTYVKNTSNINNVIVNNKLNLVYDKIQSEIDNEMIYVSSSHQIDNEIVVRLHFYICGPFKKNVLYNNDKLDEMKLPIKPSP